MIKLIVLLPLLALLVSSCIPTYTRDELDTFKIIKQDTTYNYFVKNAPGNRDRGVVSPSTKVIESSRYLTEQDSSEKRTYPDFIRLALFEVSGITGGSSANSTGLGIFGIHPNLGELSPTYQGKSGNFFTGGIYRVGIMESRIRPFKNSSNWTWGSNAFEMIAPDAQVDKNMLFSVAPIYVKKRIFLREEIPYVAVSFSGGFGYLPSQYGNLTASIDVGSIGGMNIKSFVGYVAGVTRLSGGNSVSMPYFGFGISFLDFLNLEKETYIEMKDMPHSAWEIGILQFEFFNTGAKKRFLSLDTASSDNALFKGGDLHLINTNLALPFFNNRFFVGTSLLNIIATGKNEWGMAVLPIRFGYNFTIADYGLTLTPSIESGYYPSSFINISTKIRFRIIERFNLGGTIGYVSGNSRVADLLGGTLNEGLGKMGQFSNYYIGFSVGIWDNIFTPDELRYNKTGFKE